VRKSCDKPSEGDPESPVKPEKPEKPKALEGTGNRPIGGELFVAMPPNKLLGRLLQSSATN
jgi:hypothetical protein